METYYAMIEGEVTKIRVPKTEVKNDRWEGYVVGKTVTELMTNCGAVVKYTINNNNKGEQ